MRRYLKVSLAVFLMSIFLSTGAAAVDDAIVAVVNDELISLKDLKDYIHRTYVGMVAEGAGQDQLEAVMQELEANGLQKLIEDKLILSRAKAIGIEARPKLVDERLREMEQKYGSAQNLVDALVKNGASLTDLRNKILEQLQIKFVVDHEVRPKIFVNPQEVTEFYERNKATFQKGERVNLDSIYIAFIGDPEAARRRAQEALDLIRGGADFKETAKQYSDTPAVGVVEKGQFLPEVEEQVFQLSEGEVSPLIETGSGVYIFKLMGRVPAQISSLQEVEKEVYNYIYRKKFEEHFLRWLEKLKKDAYIEIKP